MSGVQAGKGGLAGSVLLVMDSLKHLLEQDFLSRYCSPQREREPSVIETHHVVWAGSAPGCLAWCVSVGHEAGRACA